MDSPRTMPIRIGIATIPAIANQYVDIRGTSAWE